MTTNKMLEIVIVGGGIAGLATAVGLRGPGKRITVLEASRMNREIGAAISLQPNAVKILNEWGVGEELLARGGRPDSGFQIFRTDGHLQMTIPFKTTDYGADRLVFHRVDLHDALKYLATDPKREGEPAQIQVGSKVVSCDCEAGIVRLESGQEVRGDVVIGADGVHSKIRTSVVGEMRDAVPTGLSAYRLIIPRAKLQGLPHVSAMVNDDELWTTMLLGHSVRIVMGACRGKEFLSVVVLVPDEKMHEQAATSWTASGSLDELLQSISDFPPWIKDTVKLDPDMGLWQLRDLEPLSNWVKGRIILIGDAAHAMLPLQGQGASQSIEDAEAIVAYLGGCSSATSVADIRAALKAVQDARIGRASLIQQYSRQAARPATETGSTTITMNPKEFMDYNCNYSGAKEWVAKAQPAVA